ncbi:formate dehydrogenase accessory protein FdhE [Calderihabitans maritimus]|uniref:Putative formate dehydrogenase formation protein n=1 Tax=Calderihabitans maritimus TaxID=1246530 RepID=A0A1Z5HP45_9FIRM|nr:formate dehydrogenase accessory protein FdhE [Calderihabitans maritimus]GAW91091.1 putative formate dehydrogenase formation protein [Calderihabitans maritimus]
MPTEEARQVMSRMINFYDELLQLDLEEEALKISKPGEDALQQWLSGTPLIKCHLPTINTSFFLQLMDKVKDLIVSYQPERQEELSKIIDALRDDVQMQQSLAAGLFNLDQQSIYSIAAQWGVAVEQLELLLNHTLKLFLQRYAQRVAPFLDLKYWDSGICPVCGNVAHLARLEKETGKRFLYCSLCDTEWPFKRVACPRCLNENQKDLQYFTVDGQEKYRVYTCAKCKGYIKTVDERKMGGKTVDMFREDLQTIHLDLLARQEGYNVIS